MMFKIFLESLRQDNTSNLLDTISNAYDVCFENEEPLMIDPSSLTKAQLSKINTYMKRKGYDWRGADDALHILIRLGKNGYTGDIADAIRNSTIEKTLDDSAKAARYFGTTTNFNEAGYLTPKGKLIDFSGRKFGAGGGKRTLDHRQIGEVIDKSGYEGMIDFINNGNIRMHPGVGFHLIKKPTNEQISTLRSFIKSIDNEITVDITSPSGENIFNKIYPEKTNPEIILKEILSKF